MNRSWAENDTTQTVNSAWALLALMDANWDKAPIDHGIKVIDWNVYLILILSLVPHAKAISKWRLEVGIDIRSVQCQLCNFIQFLQKRVFHMGSGKILQQIFELFKEWRSMIGI